MKAKLIIDGLEVSAVEIPDPQLDSITLKEIIVDFPGWFESYWA